MLKIRTNVVSSFVSLAFAGTIFGDIILRPFSTDTHSEDWPEAAAVGSPDTRANGCDRSISVTLCQPLLITSSTTWK